MRARGKGEAWERRCARACTPLAGTPHPCSAPIERGGNRGERGKRRGRHLESVRRQPGTWSPPAAWNPPRRKSSSALLLCASSALLSAPLRRPQPLRYMHISSPLLLLFFALPFTSFVLYSHKPCAQSVTCVVPSDLVPSHKPSANNFLLLACAYLIVDTVDLCMQYQPT